MRLPSCQRKTNARPVTIQSNVWGVFFFWERTRQENKNYIKVTNFNVALVCTAIMGFPFLCWSCLRKISIGNRQEIISLWGGASFIYLLVIWVLEEESPLYEKRSDLLSVFLWEVEYQAPVQSGAAARLGKSFFMLKDACDKSTQLVEDRASTPKRRLPVVRQRVRGASCAAF